MANDNLQAAELRILFTFVRALERNTLPKCADSLPSRRSGQGQQLEGEHRSEAAATTDMKPRKERKLSSDTETLAQLYKCFNIRDIEGALAVMRSDVSWANDLEGGYAHGHAGVQEYWSRQWKMINTHAAPIEYTVGADGTIAVDVHLTARDADGNLAYDNRGQHIFRIVDGLIKHFEVRINTGTRAHP